MRYVLYYLIIGFLFLTGCQNKTPHYRIGVSQCSDDEWRRQMNNEILREALFYEGTEVDIRSANDNSQQQIQDIRNLMSQGIDLLIVAPNEATTLTPVVEEAFDQGIPIIVVDRKILSDKYSAYIGADNYEIGKAVGSYMANRLKGKGKVAEIAGLNGSTPATERQQGFMSIISQYPDITLLCSEDAGWLHQTAKQRMDSILHRYPRIDMVYAQNDRMAAGAYEAAHGQGREKEIEFVGIDALPGKGYGLEMVRDGILTATFIYPTGGDKAIQTAMNILQKQPYERENILSTTVVDPTNARVMDLQTARISELDHKIETLNGKISNYLSRYATQQVVLYGSLLILLLVAGLLLVVYKSLRSKSRLNRELSKQKAQLEEQRDQLIQLSRQLEEATHAKLVFFTNISHDFRTPLTLVADPIEQLLAGESLNGDQTRLLLLVKKNVNILLRLVNQILDFRKYENNKMEFTPIPTDLQKDLESWNDAFQPMTIKKHIHFSFDCNPETDYRMEADVEKLERIYFNLLSNAFKFTPENGKITVSLSQILRDGQPAFLLKVANTGSLISADHIRSIFDRFYKIDLHHTGSGIGLALAKAFVEMHDGTISVESDEQQGTVFSIELPVHDCESPRVQTVNTTLPPSSTTSNVFAASNDEIETETNSNYDSSKPAILIIDDNADIRTYVHELLNSEYTVIEAADGQEGIRKAMKYVPDVIVSDIMMPGMDGFECCRRLKSELQTCHIPVILLTACSLDEQRMQGYEGGADSYISKPFNSQLLLTRIRNLIDSRQRMKQFFGDGHTLAKENICDLDKDFVEKFKALIEEKMGDSGLNVEDLGKDMGLSRVQLYRKIKSLTNYAPNELLRIGRLKRAASLLASSELTVAEICYEVGFTSPSYFAKCYKEQFGESPTDLIKRKGK